MSHMILLTLSMLLPGITQDAPHRPRPRSTRSPSEAREAGTTSRSTQTLGGSTSREAIGSP